MEIKILSLKISVLKIIFFSAFFGAIVALFCPIFEKITIVEQFMIWIDFHFYDFRMIGKERFLFFVLQGINLSSILIYPCIYFSKTSSPERRKLLIAILLLPAYLFPISVSIAVGALVITDISWGYWILVSCLTMMGICCIVQAFKKIIS